MTKCLHQFSLPHTIFSVLAIIIRLNESLVACGRIFDAIELNRQSIYPFIIVRKFRRPALDTFQNTQLKFRSILVAST